MEIELPKPYVYIETTIPSYLTAWRSREAIMAGHQESTHRWWETRDRYFLFVSELVIQESSAGDPDAAARRQDSLKDIELLGRDELTDQLAHKLIREVPFPPNAVSDAVHVAIAALNGMDYLLTWNFTHIANARSRERIQIVCESFGVRSPTICTPEELLLE